MYYILYTVYTLWAKNRYTVIILCTIYYILYTYFGPKVGIQ